VGARESKSSGGGHVDAGMVARCDTLAGDGSWW